MVAQSEKIAQSGHTEFNPVRAETSRTVILLLPYGERSLVVQTMGRTPT